MKQSLRFFAIGLLTASVLLFGYYFLLDDTTKTTEELTVDELISSIEDEGYRVISESDYVAFSFFKEEEMKADNTDGKGKDKKPKKDDKEKDKDKGNKKDKDNKKDDENDANNDDTSDEKEKESDKDVITHTFTTDEGVVSQDIADILVDKKIIDDRQEFLNYLDDNGYSAKIQIGKFTVSSDMSFKELAEVITTYPGS